MKWCRFAAGSSIRFGLIEGNRVLEVAGTPFADYAVTSNSQPLAAVKLLPPVQPPMLYAAGPNYRGHLEAMAARRGQAPVYPTRPDPHFRSVHAIIATGEDIVIPADSCGRLQPEGQLAVIIGRSARKVSLQSALDYVLGYSLINDISEREWQRSRFVSGWSRFKSVARLQFDGG